MSDATEYMDIRLAMLGEGTPSFVTSTRTDHGCSKIWITDAGAPLGCAVPVKRTVGAVETMERASVVRLGESAVGSLGNRWRSPTASRLAVVGSIKTTATQVTRSIQETNRAGCGIASTTGNQPPKRVRGLIDSGVADRVDDGPEMERKCPLRRTDCTVPIQTAGKASGEAARQGSVGVAQGGSNSTGYPGTLTEKGVVRAGVLLAGRVV